MRTRLVELLACPGCRGGLELLDARSEGDWVESGHLRCSGCGCSYPVEKGIPRMLPVETLSGLPPEDAGGGAPAPFPEKNFLDETLLDYKAWKGRLALCCGCCARPLRALALGAETAVLEKEVSVFLLRGAARENRKLHPVQGDVSRPPFKNAVFDLAALDGSLDGVEYPYSAFTALARAVRGDGRLCVSFFAVAGAAEDFARLFGASSGALRLRARLRGAWRKFLLSAPSFARTAAAYALSLPGFGVLSFSDEAEFAARRAENLALLSPGKRNFVTPAQALDWLRDAGFRVEKSALNPARLRARLLARKS
ncbi:MAG: methyltransferase domain-containing protein [Elusimicrobiales bacterium]|nr:methyltransferase domain-containing protein [Elusimicrobiales bacterium]